MKNRPGFTLAELIIAVLIFGFMATSLATIYSTANRNMFQNYRSNMIKSNAALAMRDIRHNLQQATRIDLPAAGFGGTRLAFATNVDQVTGCYPVSAPAANLPAAWHYFCTQPDPIDGTITNLYHHTGTIAGNGSWCGASPTNSWTSGSYPVPPGMCGQFIAGQTVTLIMQFSVPAGGANSASMFSRIAAAPDNVYEKDSVLITLRSFWDASARGFGTNQRQRDVDFTLSSQVKVIGSGQ